MGVGVVRNWVLRRGEDFCSDLLFSCVVGRLSEVLEIWFSLFFLFVLVVLIVCCLC